MMTYFQATRPGYVKLYHTPIDSFWCCTGSGMENHAKYGDSIYFRDADSLFVNLFIPSVVDWHDKGLRLTQTTHFPSAASTQLVLRLERPTTLTLKIRQPSWCDESAVSLNGGAVQTHRTPGQYIEMRREWRDGDRIQVSLPMRLHLAALPDADSAEFAALMFGPIVLAGRLGTTGLSRGADIIINERQSGEMLHIPRELPTWSLDRKQLDRHVQPIADRPLAFRASGIKDLPNLELIPYYAIAHERYNLYWRLRPA